MPACQIAWSAEEREPISSMAAADAPSLRSRSLSDTWSSESRPASNGLYSSWKPSR
jgi:hypothetical protein